MIAPVRLLLLLERLASMESPLRETSAGSGEGYSTREVRAYVQEIEDLQAEARLILDGIGSER